MKKNEKNAGAKSMHLLWPCVGNVDNTFYFHRLHGSHAPLVGFQIDKAHRFAVYHPFTLLCRHALADIPDAFLIINIDDVRKPFSHLTHKPHNRHHILAY